MTAGGHLVILQRNIGQDRFVRVASNAHVGSADAFCLHADQPNGYSEFVVHLKRKGAARRSVRPKSREETPKEGSETSD